MEKNRNKTKWDTSLFGNDITTLCSKSEDLYILTKDINKRLFYRLFPAKTKVIIPWITIDVYIVNNGNVDEMQEKAKQKMEDKIEYMKSLAAIAAGIEHKFGTLFIKYDCCQPSLCACCGAEIYVFSKIIAIACSNERII